MISFLSISTKGLLKREFVVSQTCVMLRASALVIFPSFQSGLHPDDGHALQSSLDLRPQVEGPTLSTLAVPKYKPCECLGCLDFNSDSLGSGFFWMTVNGLMTLLLTRRSPSQRIKFDSPEHSRVATNTKKPDTIASCCSANDLQIRYKAKKST